VTEQTTTRPVEDLDAFLRACAARDRATRASEEAAELDGQQGPLALAAAEGDGAARERLPELARQAEAKREESRIAGLAAEEAERHAQAERQAFEESVRLYDDGEARRRYDEISARKAALEGVAQEALDRLAAALDRIAELDTEQRVAARVAGVTEAADRIGWHIVTNGWIAAHLREHAPDLRFQPESRKPLRELDATPTRALSPEEKRELHEERERALRERTAQEQRATAAIEGALAVESRRRELLAHTEHAQSPPHTRRDLEAQVAERLAREFPGLVEEASE